MTLPDMTAEELADALFGGRDLDWQDYAVCDQTDPDSFFPEDGNMGPAKRVCRGCPVRSQCLEYAVVNDIREGIWGGLGERQRRRLREQQGISTATQRDRAEKQAAACRMFAAGRPKAEIRQALDVSKKTLNTYLNALNTPTRKDTAA